MGPTWAWVPHGCRVHTSTFVIIISLAPLLDSLTQLAAGAAVGEAVLGPKVCRKAMVWGAVLGTLPDLDVLIPFDGPVEDFFYHRGFSHSLFLLALVSPVVAWLITRIHADSRDRFREWWLLVFLVMEIGVLLLGCHLSH